MRKKAKGKNYSKAKIKKRVFTAVLKVSIAVILRIASGSAFQRLGAADWNARSPSVGWYLELGETSNVDSFDLREYLDCFLTVIKLTVIKKQ